MTTLLHHVMIHPVMRMSEAKSDSTKPLTVRIPEEEYRYLKEYADRHRVSLNCLAAEAIAEYRAKIERGQAVADIRAFQEKLRDGRREGGDSLELLRDLRAARGNPGNSPDEKAEKPGRPRRPGRIAGKKP